MEGRGVVARKSEAQETMISIGNNECGIEDRKWRQVGWRGRK